MKLTLGPAYEYLWISSDLRNNLISASLGEMTNFNFVIGGYLNLDASERWSPNWGFKWLWECYRITQWIISLQIWESTARQLHSVSLTEAKTHTRTFRKERNYHDEYRIFHLFYLHKTQSLTDVIYWACLYPWTCPVQMSASHFSLYLIVTLSLRRARCTEQYIVSMATLTMGQC